MAAEQEGTFGSYVPDDILDQIDIRQKIHARKLPSGTADTERLYQTEYHNAPWVCLRSSVDVPIEEYKPGTKPPTDGGALAKQFILCGGTMQLVGEGDNAKLSFVGNNNLSAVGYGLDSTYGYRPRPGITKVQVKTKDTFGCIMEATVNFTVYSLDDLEAVDKLYFKPGMSALLEWGHSEYVCNDAKLCSATKARLFDLDGFFNNQDSYEEVNEKLQNWRADLEEVDGELRRKTVPQFDGNYEAMFGLVTNFSWSFNNDGSYSCTVKMLSQGTILAGLQIPAKIGLNLKKEGGNIEVIDEQISIRTTELTQLSARLYELEYGPVPREKRGGDGSENSRRQKEKEDIHKKIEKKAAEIRELQSQKANLEEVKGNGDWSEYVRKSPFHWILGQMTEQVQLGPEYKSKWKSDKYTYRWPGGTSESYEYCGRMVIQEKRWIRKDTPSPVAYIRLNDLLRIFNQVFGIQAQNLKIGFTRFETRDDKDYAEQTFLTFPEHFSLKPNEVLLPFRPSTIKETGNLPIQDNNKQVGMTIDQILNQLVVAQSNKLSDGLNRIGDISVEVGFILQCLDVVLDSEKGTYNVRDFLDNLLSGIQAALGNVNDFGIHVNHTTETASIIDRRCISHNEYGSESEKKIIIASGPQTTLTDLQINSEVSPEIASEMSIAATAPADGKKIDRSNPNQVFWNEGCIDRHRIHIIEESASGSAAEPEASGSSVVGQTTGIFADAGDFFSRAIRLYDVYNGKEAEASTAEWDCIQQDGQALFNSCLVRDLVAAGALDKTTESYLQSGIIPIKIGFTMKGIGRFVVGTTFKISKGLVPDKYKEWRQLITGVEHNIDKSGWKTTVTALYYPVIGKVGNIRPNSGTFTWDTEAANYGMADNIGEGVIYNYGEGPNNVSYLDRPTTKFFKKFWETHTKGSHNCAYYTAMMANSWVSSTMSNQGGWGNSDSIYLDSNGFVCSTFAKYAQNAGWQMVLEQRCVSKGVVLSYLESPDRQDGDIAIYFSVDSNARPNNKLYRHTQMRAPIKPKSWTTDDPSNYNCSFVYPKSKESLWNIYILRAPKMNKAWK